MNWKGFGSSLSLNPGMVDAVEHVVEPGVPVLEGALELAVLMGVLVLWGHAPSPADRLLAASLSGALGMALLLLVAEAWSLDNSTGPAGAAGPPGRASCKSPAGSRVKVACWLAPSTT